MAGREPARRGVVVAVLAAVLTMLPACTPAEESDPENPPEDPPSSISVTTAIPSGQTTIPSGSEAPVRGGCPAYEDDFEFVGDREVRQAPSGPEPETGVWFQDPVFGTCVTRVADRGADLASGDPSRGLRHEYARVQAFNADGTRLLLQGTEGERYLYDAAALRPLGALPLGAEPRWDASDPDLVHFSDGTALFSYRISSGTTALERDFAADLPGHTPVAVWTKWEGSPSADGRYRALMAEDDDWLPTAFLMYDAEQNRVWLRDLRGVPGVEDDVDHVTTSTLGTYLLAAFDRACESGTLGTGDRPCGLMVYDRDLQRGRGLLRIIGHYDTALDPAGNEVIVYQDIDTDRVAMLDLATGAVTRLFDIDFGYTAIGLHFSGLGIHRPGWVVVSTHDDDTVSHTWIDDQVLLVELQAGGRVLRLAHTRSVVDDDEELDYWAEPHATTDPGLTRVLFASNRGRTGTGAVDAYLISLPGDWPERTP